MFEIYHLAAAYAIGSAAALWLFRRWTQERIVTATIDTLIEEGYVISYVDDEGITQLSKWGDFAEMEKSILDTIDDMDPAEIEAILDEMIAEEEKQKHEEDDTP
jgi:hypothetical protein